MRIGAWEAPEQQAATEAHSRSLVYARWTIHRGEDHSQIHRVGLEGADRSILPRRRKHRKERSD
ncbi:hypothetical protein [Salinarchaeum laminariae]|uniref:hypothetical protein n=1 Tax=Salinarchaeum laminariae TaxID=869888 RepID=UPI0020BEEF48|nr:hypothetical protein [Salinarchaeum laminariae]